jgi:putative photosynthetic complex assembly protein 2
MIEHGLAFGFTVLVWWVGTAAVMLTCALPRRTYVWSFLGGCGLLAVAIAGLAGNARSLSPAAAYLSFLSAVGIWGWLEMAFLMGYLTGPRRAPCPSDATGWRRFRLAVETLLYHELSILAATALVFWLTWGAPNQTGTFAFLILVVMRISAKLNIFLGVPNLADELLPERLAYLKSYFRKRSLNLFFPVSIAGASLAAIGLAVRLAGTEGGEACGAALLLTLLALAILEHVFMILPIPDSVLWDWAIPVAATKAAQRPSR